MDVVLRFLAALAPVLARHEGSTPGFFLIGPTLARFFSSVLATGFSRSPLIYEKF
jgi:hypothetical protein